MFDKVVDNFDNSTVTLKTSDAMEPGNGGDDAQKTVDSMAKRAASKMMNK